MSERTRAAVYARKSHEQEDRAEDQRSIPRQVDAGRALVESRGWSLDEAHIYEDDGVSGALFATRRSFQRMLRAAEAGAFEALVIYDLDRFGRHGHKTMEALHLLADLGVTVYDSSTGQAIDLDSFEGRLPTILKAEFAQQYRDWIRKHTSAALRRKAEAGLVAGGLVFGYDNIGGKGERRLQRNEAEAAVVNEIFARAAAGEGYRSIAAALNAAQVASPRAQLGRASGWSASTIRAVLERELYRGEYVYGKTAKAYGRELRRVYRGSTREKGQVPKPEDTWVRIPMPHLRIVDEELCARVDVLRTDRRERYIASLKDPTHRAPQKAHGKYLLSGGMLICPQCGGHFEARRYPWRRDNPHPDGVYVCATRRRKPGTCTNTLSLPIAETDRNMLRIIEDDVLSPRQIEDVLLIVTSASDETARLTAERDGLRREIANLVNALASGVAADTVTPAIKQREAALARVEAQLRTPRPAVLDRDRLREAMYERTGEWKAALRGEPRLARLLLRRLIGPLTLHDESKEPAWVRQMRVRWRAEARREALVDGLIQLLASPAGVEPASPP